MTPLSFLDTGSNLIGNMMNSSPLASLLQSLTQKSNSPQGVPALSATNNDNDDDDNNNGNSNNSQMVPDLTQLLGKLGQ